jgi:hypothetical protein
MTRGRRLRNVAHLDPSCQQNSAAEVGVEPEVPSALVRILVDWLRMEQEALEREAA